MCAPPTWRNFDAGPAFLLEKRLPFLRKALVNRGFPDYPANIEYGDVTKELPIAEQSARGAYCSHVLEHLALNEFRAALANVFRYLAPGGTFRLVVPDLDWLANKYVTSDSTDASLTFLKDANLGMLQRNRGAADMLKAIFGRSQHLTMWDYKGMSAELAMAGFTQIRRASFKDSSDVRFLDVEDSDRWKNCLGVECFRPG